MAARRGALPQGNAPASALPQEDLTLSYSPGGDASTSNTLGHQDSTLLLGGEPLPPSRRRRRRRQGGAHRTSRQHSCPILACVSKSRVTRHRGHTRSSEARRNPVRLCLLPGPWPGGVDTGNSDVRSSFEPSRHSSFVVRRWMRVGRIVDCAADPGTGGLGSLEVWGGGRGGELGQRFKRSPGYWRRSAGYSGRWG